MEDTVASLSFGDFKLWSINALKVFLRLRKKKTNGTYDELLARYIYQLHTLQYILLYGSMGDASNESTNHRNIFKNFIFWQMNAYIDLYFTIFC